MDHICSWTERFNIIKIINIIAFSHIFYRFQTILIQILLGQANSKNLYWRAKIQEHPDAPEKLRCVSRDECMDSFSIKNQVLLKNR